MVKLEKSDLKGHEKCDELWLLNDGADLRHVLEQLRQFVVESGGFWCWSDPDWRLHMQDISNKGSSF